MKVSEYIEKLSANGQMCFSAKQAKEFIGGTEIAIRGAIRRLKQKGEIAQPIHGFYVIVPPEYRILGCRPAEHFIDDLMRHLNLPYYVGLLTAAQYYGAAHHKPQQYQVVTNQKRRPIFCGKIKIVFITNKELQTVAIEKFKTSHGFINISTPEATAKELIVYAKRCGGLDNVYTVISELIKKIDANKLEEIAINTTETPWIQRLGYLFDILNASQLSARLKKNIATRKPHTRLLSPRTGKLEKSFNKISITKQEHKKIKSKYEKNKKWKLVINKKLENDE